MTDASAPVTAAALDAAEQVLADLPWNTSDREDAAAVVRAYLDALDPEDVKRATYAVTNEWRYIAADDCGAVLRAITPGESS